MRQTQNVKELVQHLRRQRERAFGLQLKRTALAIDHAIWVLRAELAKEGRS